MTPEGKRADNKVGGITLPVASLPSNKLLDQWYNLTGDGAVGSIRIKITKTEETILPVEDYRSLTQLVMTPDLAIPNILFEANRVSIYFTNFSFF